MILNREDNETADDVINRILPQIQAMVYDVETLRESEIRDLHVGSGLVLNDERPYGVGRVTIDTPTSYQMQIDRLDKTVRELKKTNELLVKYITEHEKGPF